MIRLIVLAVVLLIALIIIVRMVKSLKRRNLERKIEHYENLLGRAKQGRVHYIRALEQAESARQDVDRVASEAGSLMNKVRQLRESLRKLIHEIRRLRAQDTGSTFDRRNIEEKKTQFARGWKVYGDTKTSLRNKRLELIGFKERWEQLSDQARLRTEAWQKQKKEVLDFYESLRGQIKISNPKYVLLQDSSR